MNLWHSSHESQHGRVNAYFKVKKNKSHVLVTKRKKTNRKTYFSWAWENREKYSFHFSRRKTTSCLSILVPNTMSFHLKIEAWLKTHRSSLADIVRSLCFRFVRLLQDFFLNYNWIVPVKCGHKANTSNYLIFSLGCFSKCKIFHRIFNWYYTVKILLEESISLIICRFDMFVFPIPKKNRRKIMSADNFRNGLFYFFTILLMLLSLPPPTKNVEN